MEDPGGGAGSKTRRRPGRAPTACAECRRLKLRCDKNVPCTKCVTRGVASICPQGTLTTGKGNRRLVLPGNEGFDDRVETLNHRIRELEEALRTLQANPSSNPHPWLHEDAEASQVTTTSMTATTMPLDSTSNTASTSRLVDDPDAFSDAFGTLCIQPDGQTTFIGQTAQSEYLIRVLADSLPTFSAAASSRLPKRVLEAAFREFQSSSSDHLAKEIFSLLPLFTEATRLCEIYLEQGKCLYHALPRQELFDEILAVVYRSESFDSVANSHVLSLLLIIFTLAVFFDPIRKPYPVEAQEFFLLCCASLNLSPSHSRPTLFYVQTLIHIAQYLDISGCQPVGLRDSSMYVALAIQSALSMGLHINSTRWNLDEAVTQKRNRVFWQLFLLDTCTSFSLGRPPSIFPGYVDCPLPTDTDQVANKDGNSEMGYQSWAWRYAKLMRSVLTNTFGTKVPPYATVLDMDQRIRDFAVPYHLRPICKTDGDSPSLHLQRWLVHFYKETTLLNLHRCYFAQALRELPSDLLKHKYGPSVMAIYLSVWRTVECLALFWKDIPHVLSRIGIAWSQSLSAAVVLCLLVTRAPSSCLATSSMEQLEKVVGLFAEAASECQMAATNLESIRKFHLTARRALDKSSQDTSPTTLTLAELDRLGGKTTLISGPPSDFTSPRDDTDPSPTASVVVVSPQTVTFRDRGIWSGIQDESMRHQPHMHPTIVQDMMLFNGFGTEHRLSLNDMFDYPSESLPPDSPEFVPSDHNAAAVWGMSEPLGTQPFGGGGGFTTGYQSPNTCFGPPVLDASWQGFLEQLGF